MKITRKHISLIIALILGLLTCSCGMSEVSDENIPDDAESFDMEEKVSGAEVERDDDLPVDDPGNVQSNNAVNIQEKIYSIEEYGVVEERQQDFFDSEDGIVVYYYKMENFLLHDNFPNADLINNTLQQIYDEKEKDYIESAEIYSSEDEGFDTPYSYWHIMNLEYIGEDYISILYNDVYYMGGAHPYSYQDGITIDCKTGEQISASQLMEKSDEEILAEVSDLIGLDVMGTWEDMDFYLTDSTIVFFYRTPGFWEDAVLQRGK